MIVLRNGSYIYYEIIRSSGKFNRMQPNSKQRIAGVIILIVAVMGLSALVPPGYQLTQKDKGPVTDTIPAHKKTKEKREYRVGDLDKALKEIDLAMIEMDKTVHIDMDKVNQEIKLAIEEVKRIDVDKINREVAAALKEVDWKSIQTEVNKALSQVSVRMDEAEKKELKEELKNAEKEVKEELKNAEKEIKEENVKTHGYKKELRLDLDKSLSTARTGLEKAKTELITLKEFTGSLEKEGLISKKKGYKIEIKNDELYINGNKQSKDISDRYRKYYKEKEYTIVSDGDKISSL